VQWPDQDIDRDTEPPPEAGDNPLLAYSQGRLDRHEAVRLLGLRDYAQLLVALGDAGLAMPEHPAVEIEEQAETFVRLWNQP
jgi:hypothetical protein